MPIRLLEHQSRLSHLHQKIEEPGVQGFGERVPGEARLLLVQRHVDHLRLSAPFTVHLAAGQLLLQPRLVNAQQIGWEGQD